MNTRDDMIASIKRIIVPELRNRGFTGSFPHFRRIHDQVDLLTFQFDRNGGGFLIEIAKGEIDGFKTHWGKQIPASKLKAWDLHPDQRTRLKPIPGSGTDSWFRYDRSVSCDDIARDALHRINIAEPGAAANASRR